MDPNLDGETLPEHDPRILLMVSGLQSQITDLEEKYNKSLLENAHLKDLLATGKSDSADIYYFLQKKLDDNYNNINELECQIIKEQSDRELAEIEYEKKIKELETINANEKETNTKVIKELEEKLLSLNEFQERREVLEQCMEEKIKDCKAMEEDAAKSLLEMEKKCIREKEALRKEMLTKIQETKANLIDASKDRLDEITKETMMENDQLRMELKLQARESEKIIQHSARLEKENKDLKCLLDLARATELELMKRMSTYGKVARKLQNNLSNQQRQQRILLESRNQERENDIYKNEIGEEIKSDEGAKEAVERDADLENASLDTMHSASVLDTESINYDHNEKTENYERNFQKSIEEGKLQEHEMETSTVVTGISTIVTKTPSTTSFLTTNPLQNGQKHFKEGKTYPSNWIGSIHSENRSIVSSDTTVVAGGSPPKSSKSITSSDSLNTTRQINGKKNSSKLQYNLSKKGRAELNAAGKIRLGAAPKQNSMQGLSTENP